MQTWWLASNFTNSAPLGRCSLAGMAASELSKRARSEETLQIMKDVKGQFFFSRQGIISGSGSLLLLYLIFVYHRFI